jgi:hypothetical protein
MRFLERRRAAQAARYEAVQQTLQWAEGQGLVAGRIQHVHQRARRGSKAVVILSTGYVVDCWFWYFRPEAGSFVVIQPSVGFGPHTGSSQVHFIGSETGGPDVRAVVPRRDVAFFDRYRARAARRTTRDPSGGGR